MHVMNVRFCLIYLFYTVYGYLLVYEKKKKESKNDVKKTSLYCHFPKMLLKTPKEYSIYAYNILHKEYIYVVIFLL